jgi:hypothetical protein
MSHSSHSTHSPEGNSGSGIGLLEPHLHEVFASDRLTSDDFIYAVPFTSSSAAGSSSSTPLVSISSSAPTSTVVASSNEFFNTLEDYCDDQQLHLPRSPLLILGQSGAGKSALLANWLQRRTRNLSRNRHLTHTRTHNTHITNTSRNSATSSAPSASGGLTSGDEYIFWHVVGCTRHSCNVRKMMKRLLTDLKQRFELSRSVSLDPGHLSWDLPRFLELAAKKGRVLLVIDGLHRFEPIEGETNLSWLPLEFPPNVRVVISATYPSLSDQSHRTSHVLAELER